MTLISIEGCLGVGKSTLVQRVAKVLPCAPFYEDVEANPFLLDFYRDPKHFSIHAQYTFLLLQARRFQASIDHARTNEGKKGAMLLREQEKTSLCDFHPFKSIVFSSVVLQPEERAPLSQLYRLLRIPQPDLVIYLKADESTIMGRLRKRDDLYRADVDFTYITSVCQAYENFFRTYAGPYVTIDTTHIDYVGNPQEVSVVLQHIPLLFSSLCSQSGAEQGS